MREIIFYETESGKSPVEEFLESLSPKEAQKVTWVLRLIEELPTIPKKYFKKLRFEKYRKRAVVLKRSKFGEDLTISILL